MADSASRSLLAPTRDSTPVSPPKGKRSTLKLPLLIFFFLVVLIGCIAASIAILVTSHKDAVSSWHIRPAIVLSILSGVYAVVLGALLTVGAAVVWWRSLSHGSSLAKLHYIYAGSSLQHSFSAFTAGNASRVTIAAVVVFAAQIATGPMLQRSTKPEMQDVKHNADLNINLAQEIPDGWFGTWDQLSSDGIKALQATYANANITTLNRRDYFCSNGGVCETTVVAAGLNFVCSSDNESLDLSDSANLNATLFSVKMEMDDDSGVPTLFLEAKYISSVKGCTGTLTTDTCKMIPARTYYPISVRDHHIRPNFTDAVENLAIVGNYSSAGDTSTGNQSALTGPLGGIMNGLSPVLTAEAYLSNITNGNVQYAFRTKADSAPFNTDIYRTFPDASDTEADSKCNLVWSSPTNPTLVYVLQFLFRSSYDIGSTDDAHRQALDATYKGREFQYITDFGWLSASIAVMALALAAALSLLWGFWQLDHYVTLSPLETAKALGAPVLLTADPEREANSIVDLIGHEKVAHDGDELVWNGSLYATGVGSTRSMSRRETRQTSLGDVNGNLASKLSLKGRGHRRGMSSVSDASDVHSRRPSFEHNLGYTTRKPYDDEEEEMDIGLDISRHRKSRDSLGVPPVKRPRSTSQGSDSSLLAKRQVSFTAFASEAGSPELPPIPQTGSLMVEPISPPARPRKSSIGNGKGKARAFDAHGLERRPLSKISEKSSRPPSGYFEGPEHF